jgi:hypothetical protein
MDSFNTHYLRLTLEIHKHIDGYVDAYYGPAELRAAVEQSEKRPLVALLDDLAQLRATLPTADPARYRYLAAACRAMETSVRLQNGEQMPYPDEVASLFDIHPQFVPEAEFIAATRELDTLLPGTEALAERLNTFTKPYEIAAAELPRAIELVRAETRNRTRQLIDLVGGEDIATSIVTNQPWSAYNWYKGGAQSLIEFNTDLPVSALRLLDLMAHEGYPGHHTEHQLKERHLYHERNYGETASALLLAPSAVIAEGIATTAIEIIFPKHSHFEWTAQILLPALNLPPLEAEFLHRLNQAQGKTRMVSGNAAHLYHTGKLNEAQAIEYIQTYAAATEKRAKQSFRFISNPLFRAYTYTYTEGYALIEKAAKGGDKTPLFKRLLVEQILPSELAAM